MTDQDPGTIQHITRYVLDIYGEALVKLEAGRPISGALRILLHWTYRDMDGSLRKQLEELSERFKSHGMSRREYDGAVLDVVGEHITGSGYMMSRTTSPRLMLASLKEEIDGWKRGILGSIRKAPDDPGPQEVSS